MNAVLPSVTGQGFLTGRLGVRYLQILYEEVVGMISQPCGAENKHIHINYLIGLYLYGHACMFLFLAGSRPVVIWYQTT